MARRYDYRCKHCHKKFEAEHHPEDKSIQKCPKCGSDRTRKIIGKPNISFKGSGFTLSKSE